MAVFLGTVTTDLLRQTAARAKGLTVSLHGQNPIQGTFPVVSQTTVSTGIIPHGFSLPPTGSAGFVDAPPAASIQSNLHILKDLVFIDQQEVRLGLVTGDITLTLSIWNAFDVPITLNAVTVTSAQGLSIITPPDGTVMTPQEEIPFQVFVEELGSPFISATVAIQAGASVYFFTIEGVRARSSYLLGMQWAGGTSMVRRFLTDVYKAGTTAETRRILRHVPIREITTPITYYNKETALQARSTVALCTKDDYILPLYPDISLVTQPNTPTKIFCDTSYRRFEVGAYAIISRTQSQGGYEELKDVIKISLVEPDGISTVAPIANTYAVGDKVHPAMICHAAFSGVSRKAFNDRSGEYSITSEEVYGQGFELENAGYSPSISAGHPVYPFPVNYIEGIDSTFTRAGVFEESGRGQAYYTLGAQTATSLSLKSIFSSREAWWEAVGFFNYIKGRARKFWLTEPVDMFEVALYTAPDTLDLTTKVVFEDLEYITYLWLKDASGDTQIVSVLSISSIAGGARLVFDSLTIGEPIEIRRAFIARLESDEVQEDWITNSIVEITTSAKELTEV